MTRSVEDNGKQDIAPSTRLDVLHLEDSPYDAELIRLHILDSIGHASIDWVKNRESFEESLESGVYDIILIDYDVPNFNDNEAIIIAKERQPWTPVICVTGAIGEDKAISIMRSGATDYVLKDHLSKLDPAIKRAVKEAENRSDKLKMQKERERLFREVLDREIRYRMLFEAAGVGMALIDAKTMRFIDVNAHLVKTLGHTKDEFVDRKVFDLFRSEDEESGDGGKDDLNGSGTSDIFVEGEFFAETVEGDILCFEVNIAPGGESNDTELLVASVHDITERKEFKKRMLDMNEDLERRVQERTAALKKASGELEASLEKERTLGDLKSRFVSIVSHQFRTPLTVIKSSVAIMSMQKNEMSDKIKEVCNRAATRIDQQVDRMTDLMEDVLEMGKINAERIEPRPVEVDLDVLVNEIVERLNDIEHEATKVDLSIKGAMQKVRLDPQLFDHALSNVISNALKYSDGEPGPRVELTYGSDTVTIEVIDHGIGIPEKELPNLFEPFFRASNVENREGTGLGLAIVKEYVELNSGSITVQSQTNQGTRVRMTYNTPLS